MKTELMRADHPVALKHALDILAHGGLVAFPTDTVYGLAAQLFSANSVEALYVAKGRNTERAIAVLIGDLKDLGRVAREMTAMGKRLAERLWPGPITLIVPGNPALPANLSPTSNVGVRMPDHPIALAFLKAAGPLAVTSANLSGRENALNAQEVLNQLEGRIHLVLDGGAAPGGVPSTVVDCTGDELMILRVGPISLEEMQAALKPSETLKC